MDNISVVVQDT